MPQIITLPAELGYKQGITGLVAGEWVEVAIIPKFSSGKLYISTNQSGDAPQFQIEYKHSFSHVYLAVSNIFNNATASIDLVRATGASSGSPASIWLHWSMVSAPDFDISCYFIHSNADNDVITWGVPLVRSAAPPPAVTEVEIKNKIQTFFPSLVLPPDVTPPVTSPDNRQLYGAFNIPAGSIGKRFFIVTFPAFPADSAKAMKFQMWATYGIEEQYTEAVLTARFTAGIVIGAGDVGLNSNLGIQLVDRFSLGRTLGTVAISIKASTNEAFQIEFITQSDGAKPELSSGFQDTGIDYGGVDIP